MASTSRQRRARNPQVLDSDEEEDHLTRHESTAHPQTIDLSDDEDLIPPPPPFVQQPAQQMPSTRHPVREALRRRGVVPRVLWLDSCMNELAAGQPGFLELSPERQAELCFVQFLMADFNAAGDGCLPPSVHGLHGTELPGPFVLQVDEVTDIGQPLRERYQERPAKPSRILKLSMTDGVQRILGIEYRPIKVLDVLAPAGLKISVKNVCVKRGLLMLVPEIVEILGGHVERLESARLRAVQFINKPPRGRWVRRSATEQPLIEPPLVERAAAAAWPDNQAEVNVAPPASNYQPEDRSSHSAARNPQGARPTVDSYNFGVDDNTREPAQQRTEHRPVTQVQHARSLPQPRNVSHNFGHSGESALPQDGQQPQPMDVDNLTRNNGRGPSVNEFHRTGVGTVQQDGHHGNVHDVARSSGEVAGNLEIQSQRLRNLDPSEQVLGAQQERDGGSGRLWNTSNAGEPTPAANRPFAEERTSTNPSADRSGTSSASPSLGRLSLQSRRPIQPKFTPPLAAPRILADEGSSRPNESEQNVSEMGSSSTVPRVEALEDPNAYTFLAVLKGKIDSEKNPEGVVRGRVKCVILGVISFKHQGRDEFELRIHIEDGSLITPAFVHHQLVQTLIGYPPGSIGPRLKDPETQEEMTSNMSRFQKFLQKFEGFMQVEWSKSASEPTVLEISKGMDFGSIRSCVERFSKAISGSSRVLQAPNRLVPTIDLTEE